MPTNSNPSDRQGEFVRSLHAFAQQHRASHWSGTFADFLEKILPTNARGIARTAHQYVWDMIRWQGSEIDQEGHTRYKLFADELYGIDDALERLADYFKAASAGSEVGRRLLLMLGPPSGGKSSIVILLKRGLEEYSHTDEGAIYAIQGCPVNESPLHLVPYTLRPQFREIYGVEIVGDLCPLCRTRLERRMEAPEATATSSAVAAGGATLVGDFMRMPVQRIFISEAGRVGIGTYAPHDPSTADIADLVGSVDLSKVVIE